MGDTIVLKGNSAGETLSITPVAVADPAPPASGFDRPEQGHRLVAVQVRMENSGSSIYSDAPDNCATLIDSIGQRFHPSLATTAAGPGFQGGVTIPVGGIALGYVVFEVPADSQVAQLQFTLDSGFGHETGQWIVHTGGGQSETAAGPDAVVLRYFDAINNGDYATAWKMGGSNFSPSYDQFVAGFADTVWDTVTVTSVNGDVVAVRIEARQSDGSIRYYAGTYTVRDGVLVRADIRGS